GVLVNRINLAYAYSTLQKEVTLDNFSLSDLELIAIGAFSPLTGFMGKADYESVVENMRLADGTVWSIPITLPVTEETAKTLHPGDQVKLIHQGAVYGVLDLTEIFVPDKQNEAVKVY